MWGSCPHRAPITPLTRQASPRAGPALPAALTGTKGLRARPVLAGLADPQGGALALVAAIAQVLAGGAVVVAVGGAGDVPVLGRFQDGAALHCGGKGTDQGLAGMGDGARSRGSPSPWTRMLNLQLARL